MNDEQKRNCCAAAPGGEIGGQGIYARHTGQSGKCVEQPAAIDRGACGGRK